MPSDAMPAARDERGWLTSPGGPQRPFGAALTIGNPIETPALITERVRKLRGSPACPACGNRGPWQCACEVGE